MAKAKAKAKAPASAEAPAEKEPAVKAVGDCTAKELEEVCIAMGIGVPPGEKPTKADYLAHISANKHVPKKAVVRAGITLKKGTLVTL